MKKRLIGLMVLGCLVVIAVPSARAAKKPTPPPQVIPSEPETESWYRGIIEAVDLKAGKLILRPRIRGQTVHQRMSTTGVPMAVSSSAPVPPDESSKTFTCSRDCRFLYPENL